MRVRRSKGEGARGWTFERRRENKRVRQIERRHWDTLGNLGGGTNTCLGPQMVGLSIIPHISKL